MKSICSKHDRAYEVSEGCCYCVPEVKGAVAVIAQATPVAAVRCFRTSAQCSAPPTWRWRPLSEQAKSFVLANGDVCYCDEHQRTSAAYFSSWPNEYAFEKIP